MKYEFYCAQCNAIDEVERPVIDAHLPYQCPDCNGTTRRNYTPPQVVTKGEQVKYYHPAFGRVMSDSEAQAEAKQRGWVEVGNESVANNTPPPKRVSYDEPDYFV